MELRPLKTSGSPHSCSEESLSRKRGQLSRNYAYTAGHECERRQDSGCPFVLEIVHNAGLAELFERQFAANSARQYKPSRPRYEMVSQELNVSAASVCMVAAHVWD